MDIRIETKGKEQAKRKIGGLNDLLMNSATRSNYRPLMWPINRQYRAALFCLSQLLTFRSATYDKSLIDALK